MLVKGTKPSDGKSKKKKKWHNSNPENKTTMEKNGRKYFWCKIFNYGRGRWVDHKEEVCPNWRKQDLDESSPNSDNAGGEWVRGYRAALTGKSHASRHIQYHFVIVFGFVWKCV